MTQETFADIFNAMSADEKRELAENAGTTVKTLYQYVRDNSKHSRSFGVDLGARIKKADPRMTDAVLWPERYG